MKNSPDHLPEQQQRELERVRAILLEEFDKAIATATQPHRRDDWVDEPENGYQSDFDLLVIVSHTDLTDIADYWYIAEDRIARDLAITRPVNIIVHALDEVNQALSRGEYFWVDIARDGVALYELPCHPLATPKALTATDAHTMANNYFNQWSHSVDVWIERAGTAIAKADDPEWAKAAAFDLHQATERLYICYLLVRTLYFPRSHNIKFLRSLAEDKEPRLIAAWPRDTRADRARFERLKRAYVEARYSANYAISLDDLSALAASIAQLREIVAVVCAEQLAALDAAASAAPD